VGFRGLRVFFFWGPAETPTAAENLRQKATPDGTGDTRLGKEGLGTRRKGEKGKENGGRGGEERKPIRQNWRVAAGPCWLALQPFCDGRGEKGRARRNRVAGFLGSQRDGGC